MPARILTGCGILPAALAVIFVGCSEDSDGLPRQAISGTVTLEGQPLQDGSIQFLPTSQREVLSGGAVVADGRFSISRREGLTPGDYRVVITSAPSETSVRPTEAPGLAPEPAKERIPEKYNRKSTLTAKVEDDGPNTFEFRLTK